MKAHEQLDKLYDTVKAEGNCTEYVDEMISQLEIFGTETNSLTIDSVTKKVGVLAGKLGFEFYDDQPRKGSVDYLLMEEKVKKMRDVLAECKLQLEYLNEKFGETGTTNQLLGKVEAVK